MRRWKVQNVQALSRRRWHHLVSRAGHAPDVVHPLLLPSMKPESPTKGNTLETRHRKRWHRRDAAGWRIVGFTPHAQLERRCQCTSGFSTIALLLGEWQNQDLKMFVVVPVPASVTDMRREGD